MSSSDPAVEASYAYCHRVARRSGSSFYPCFLVLRRPKRRAMEALYAYTRHTDDLVDNPQPVRVRREELAGWRASVVSALSDHFCPSCEGVSHQAELERSHNQPAEAVLPALADSVKRFGIPPEHLQAVIDGCRMDLDGRRYETFDELTDYCHRVASSVGLACLHVWGFRGEEAFRPARACGLAFQMTNILRDLKEDVQQGRVYLPTEDFRRARYSPDDLANSVVDARFHHLVQIEINRVERLYREAAELMRWLEPDGRRIFGMMWSVYHRLFEEIKGRKGRVFCERVRLDRWHKLGIAARWVLLPTPKPEP